LQKKQFEISKMSKPSEKKPRDYSRPAPKGKWCPQKNIKNRLCYDRYPRPGAAGELRKKGTGVPLLNKTTLGPGPGRQIALAKPSEKSSQLGPESKQVTGLTTSLSQLSPKSGKNQIAWSSGKEFSGITATAEAASQQIGK